MHIANREESALLGANRIPGKSGGVPGRSGWPGYLTARARINLLQMKNPAYE